MHIVIPAWYGCRRHLLLIACNKSTWLAVVAAAYLFWIFKRYDAGAVLMLYGVVQWRCFFYLRNYSSSWSGLTVLDTWNSRFIFQIFTYKFSSFWSRCALKRLRLTSTRQWLDILAIQVPLPHDLFTSSRHHRRHTLRNYSFALKLSRCCDSIFKQPIWWLLFKCSGHLLTPNLRLHQPNIDAIPSTLE